MPACQALGHMVLLFRFSFWHEIGIILTEKSKRKKTDVCRASTRECSDKFHPIRFWWAQHDWTKYGFDVALPFLARMPLWGAHRPNRRKFACLFIFSKENDFGVSYFLLWSEGAHGQHQSIRLNGKLVCMTFTIFLLFLCIPIWDQFMLASHCEQSRQWCRQP